MERHLIVIMDEKTGRILASRVVAKSLVNILIENLDRYVGRTTTVKDLKTGLVSFGFQLTSQTVAYRITGL